MGPTPETQDTHILKRSLGQLVIPSIFDLLDLSILLVIKYLDLRVDRLLLADAFHLIPRSHIQGNGIAS